MPLLRPYTPFSEHYDLCALILSTTAAAARERPLSQSGSPLACRAGSSSIDALTNPRRAR